MTEFNDNQYWHYGPVPLGAVSDGKMVDAGYDAVVLSSVGEGPAGPQGPAGDTIDFDDLSDEQIARIYQNASFVTNKTRDAVITTETGGVTTIQIPSSLEYDQFDMLFVDVNGLDLAEGVDYTISGNSIVLTTPLPLGQDVHFRVMKYDLVDGDKTIIDRSTTEIIHDGETYTVIHEGTKSYQTVADMKADADKLEAGDIVHALGRESAGDRYAGWYVLKRTGTANGTTVVKVGTLYAHLMYYDNYSKNDEAENKLENAKSMLMKVYPHLKFQWMLQVYKYDGIHGLVQIPALSNYWPICAFSPGNGILYMSGEFTMLQDVVPTCIEDGQDPVEAGATPIFVSEYRPAKPSKSNVQCWRHCLNYYDENLGRLRTLGLAIDKDGYMYLIDNIKMGTPLAPVKVPKDAVLRLDLISMSYSLHGDFTLPWITKSDAQKAAKWMKDNRGKFYYANHLMARLHPLDYNFGNARTDCSGAIYAAFYYSSGGKIRLPNAGGAQCVWGKLISYAKAGDRLDLSKAEVGDIILYFTQKTNNVWHVAMVTDVNSVTGEVTAYEQNGSYTIDNVPQVNIGTTQEPTWRYLGPQPIADAGWSYGSTHSRFLMRITEAAGLEATEYNPAM